MHVIVLPLSNSFLICTEKLIYFSVYSPKHLNLPLNSLASFSVIKWLSYVDQLWKTTVISFSLLYLRLKLSWVARLYFPV